MNSPACKKYFMDNYVIEHITVYESKGKEALNNPGSEDLLKKYHGENRGIHYWMIFDSEGTMLADVRSDQKKVVRIRLARM